MYFDYFDIKRPPFRITPDTQAFYAGAKRGPILHALMYAITQGDAIIKLVGEVGSGKTMLCRMLEKKLPPNIDVVYLGNPRLSPDNILQAIAFELDIPINQHDSASRIVMLKTLQDHLLTKHMQNRQVVVFVEEAQCMPLETLEEIRLLSNLETEKKKLLQVVLFGQPELDDNLSQSHVRQIKDRISNSFYLPTLELEDVNDYILYRLYTAGYRGQHLFSKSAVALISKSTHGLMRRINILADKALLAAYTSNSRQVEKKHVRMALRDAEFHSPHRVSWSAILSSLFGSVLLLCLGMLWNKLPEKNARFLHDSDYAVKTRANRLRDFVLARKRISRQWLKSVNLNHYSIQVLLAGTAGSDGLEHLLNQEGISEFLDEMYIVDTTINGTKMLGVLYGEYRTLAEAKQALDALPEVLRRYKPRIQYLRRVLPPTLSVAAVKNIQWARK